MKIIVVAYSLLILSSIHSPAIAVSDEDMWTLGMYYELSDLVVSADRDTDPLKHIDENISVITAKEMETMGANTLVYLLADVLGIRSCDQLRQGIINDYFDQGRCEHHILIMINGTPLDQTTGQSADLCMIPVQNVERIEILKVPLSSYRGAEVDVFVNIVTISSPDLKN